MERSSSSTASRIGRRRLLAGSSGAMAPNWDENRISAVLRATIQMVMKCDQSAGRNTAGSTRHSAIWSQTGIA